MTREISRYEIEAPAPAGITMHETIRYLFDEALRRVYHASKGLDDRLINEDLGHGAMTIGAILQHQLRLIRFITLTIEPGSLDDLPSPDFGPEGSWHFEPMLEHREVLAERFRTVLARAPESAFLERRTLPPEPWKEWPVLMRVLRPLTDFSTHTGQVNYIRRLLGKPVERY